MKYRVVQTGEGKYRIQVKLSASENGFIAITSNWTACWEFVSDYAYHTKEDAEKEMNTIIERVRLSKLKNTIKATYEEIEV